MTRLMQFDPFNEVDRVLQQVWGSARQAHMPMDAYRHGDSFVVHLDLPGVDPASIDVSIEQNVLMVSAERHWESVEGDEVVCNERRQGQFSRQLVLGRSLDADNIHATYDHGVLTLTIPVAEAAKPRKVEIATSRDAKQEAIPTKST